MIFIFNLNLNIQKYIFNNIHMNSNSSIRNINIQRMISQNSIHHILSNIYYYIIIHIYIIIIYIIIYKYYQVPRCQIKNLNNINDNRCTDARGWIELTPPPAPSAPRAISSAPRAREHQAVPNAPGGAIAGVLDCGDCAACCWFQTFVGGLN